MIGFEDRQKVKILKSVHTRNKTYEQINKETGIKIDSIRGRLSELRRKGLVEKQGNGFKITDDGINYLLESEAIEV